MLIISDRQETIFVTLRGNLAVYKGRGAGVREVSASFLFSLAKVGKSILVKSKKPASANNYSKQVV